MNTNESTDIVRACAECGAEVGPVRHKCDKCHNRSGNSDPTHELALVEDMLRRGKNSLDEVWNSYAYSYNLLSKAQREITDGGDYRIEGLWQKLWGALDGDIERDQTWDMFMDAIPGLPDYRVKTYGGVVTLKFYFSEVEVESDSFDIEQAICDAISGDLRYGYHDEMEVEYDEE